MYPHSLGAPTHGKRLEESVESSQELVRGGPRRLFTKVRQGLVKLFLHLLDESLGLPHANSGVKSKVFHAGHKLVVGFPGGILTMEVQLLPKQGKGKEEEGRYSEIVRLQKQMKA